MLELTAMHRCGWTLALLLAGSLSSASASEQWQRLNARATEGIDPVKALMVVDCLLPGQVRRSGRVSYIGPALPVKTTAEVCEKRGGEYVAYDRATLANTLRVWMEKAQGGDVEAQLFIAQAYERGIDRPADPAKAAEWYRKAAAKGSRQAKLSLAAMMETGTGMPVDPDAALALYRDAMGLTEDLVRASEAQARISETRLQLEAEKAEADARIARLQSEVAALKSARAQEARLRERKQAELATAQAQQTHTLERLYALPPAQTRSISRQESPGRGAAPALTVDGARFGRYYALVVGVQDYENIEPLKTPLADAQAVADVLQRRYGFTTTLLRNPDYHTLTGEIVRILTNRAPEDNVLIYYAGHGELKGTEGFWLPRDVDNRLESALPNSLLAASMNQFTGRSLLVIADSCFGAALAAPREISGPLEYFPGDSASFLANKGRYVLSAGGETPVIDDGGQGHSVFTSHLLRVLETNERVLTQRGLAEAVRPAVQRDSSRLGNPQTPQVAPMRDGLGYEGGKFYLVPVDGVGRQLTMQGAVAIAD